MHHSKNESKQDAHVLPSADINEILRHMPHRYPFLLIDRMEGCEPHRWVKVTKNLTSSEWFFGDRPPYVMPQLLVVEALAQTAGVLCHYSGMMSKIGQSLIFFAGIDNFESQGDAFRGDQITLECVLNRSLRGVAKLTGTASVGTRRILAANLTAVVRTAT